MNLSTSTVILPGHDDWYIDGDELRIMACAGVSRDAFVFAGVLHGNNHAIYEDYARFYRYDAGRWLCIEVETKIASMMMSDVRTRAEKELLVLGESGNVWFIGRNTSEEGIDPQDAFIAVRLKKIDGNLTCIGLDGKLFKRTDAGWVGDGEGMADRAVVVPRPRKGDHDQGAYLSDLVTTSDISESYACGSAYIARPVLYWRKAGQRWEWLGLNESDLRFDEVNLRRMHVQGDDDILISTNRGYILRGNGRHGFKVASDVLRHPLSGAAIGLGNFATFEGATYVGGGLVSRIRPDGTFEPQTGPAYRDMRSSGTVSTLVKGSLEVVDGVMWAFSSDVVSRYDGRAWERITIPALYRR